MLKMEFLSLLCLLSLLSNLSGSSQESVLHLALHDSSSLTLQQLSRTDSPVAISVSNERLNDVSNSIIGAETWVRTHVLTRYPATKITTIVVGHNLLCNKTQEEPHTAFMILPSLNNIFHSLTRWGLEREIKVSASFSSDCLDPSSEKHIKPILSFLQNTNSPYLINPPPHFSLEEILSLVSSHTESIKNIGGFTLNRNKINVLKVWAKEESSKTRSRKLSSMVVEPFPSRPTPLTPTHSPVGYPLPPLVGTSPPAFSVPFAPELPPIANPPYHSPNLPPCNPYNPIISPAPMTFGGKSELWCVAKPSVPADTLQEAMDYACGEGGADCEAIKPEGSCYYPDTMVAHASYAFNSYWQKNKRNGGTCGFGGTAMLINADPSFRHCRFLLA